MCQYNSSCNSNCTTTCVQDTCGCLSKYSGECIIYDGEELTCTSIAVGLNLNDLVKQIDSYFCIFRNEIMNFISITNIGNGAKVYKSDNLLGQKQLRTIVAGSPSLTVMENDDDITIDVQQASETLAGVIQIATQAETDAGTDAEKAVTPSTLTTLLSNPANLPNATETNVGVAEIATQAEVNTGLDDERIITPAKLQQGVETIVQSSTVIEQYVEGEVVDTVLNNTDLQNFITNIAETVSSDPANLPNSTETQRGIIELATQAEVDAGTDAEKAVTPATLAAATSAPGGSIPIGLISMWSGSPTILPTGWSICDGTSGTPDLRGRFIVGFDLSNPDYNSVGNTGGLDEVTLTEAQMPIHNHSVNAFRNDQQSVDNGGGSVVADQVANATIGDAGGDQPHENRPPYYTLAYIMFTG